MSPVDELRVKSYFTEEESKIADVYGDPPPRRSIVPVETEAVIFKPISK
ncbi:MAG: hypothetical protein ACW99F_17315 [Candidatus Hodarchaeales archaeon]|jgi:hypothetical protein